MHVVTPCTRLIESLTTLTQVKQLKKQLFFVVAKDPGSVPLNHL